MFEEKKNVVSRYKLFDETSTCKESEVHLDKKIENSNQEIVLDLNSALSLDVEKYKTRNYECTLLFESIHHANEIKYEIRITCLGFTEENTILYQLERTSSVYINQSLPDLLVDKIAMQAGKVFYPLVIETDRNSSYLQIKNFEEIKSRWPIIKKDLEQNFEGQYAEEYFNLMDSRLEDEYFTQLVFKDDWFVKVYFQNIYKKYSTSLSAIDQLFFPNLEVLSLGYKTTQALNRTTNDNGDIELTHKGDLITDELNEDKGTYEATYHLKAVSKCIQSIIASWTILNLNEDKVTFKLLELEVDTIEGLSSSMHQSSLNNLVLLDGNQKVKTSFWDKLF